MSYSLGVPPEESKSIVRPLGVLEEYLSLVDQVVPRHFAVAARVRGSTDVGAWRKALDSVQSRHPLFSVAIEKNKDKENGSHFRSVNDALIPLRVVRGPLPSDWEIEIEKELSTPFVPQAAPLVRAVLLHEPDESIFMLVAHHSIGDGLSLVYAIRDTLHALAGGRLNALPTVPSQEDLLRSLANGIGAPEPDASSNPLLAGPAEDVMPNNSIPQVNRLALERGVTRKMREVARKEGTTVHGAVCAALLLAGRQLSPRWTEMPVRVASPLDVRKLLGLTDNVTLSVSLGIVSFPAGLNLTFWELARYAKHGLSGARTLESLARLTGNVASVLAGVRDAQSAYDSVRRATRFEMVVTNLGEVPYGSHFGDLVLEELWGPAVVAGLGDRQAVGVATVNGSLRMLHVSYLTMKPLLEVAGQILISATRQD